MRTPAGRRLGRTDITVSSIGFGCARIGGLFAGSSPDELAYLLLAAQGRGITFFDTADMYCQGESERVLGRAFRGRRHEVVIASKVGYVMPTRRRAISYIKPLVRPLVRRLGLRRGRLTSGLGGVQGTLAQNFSPEYIIRAVEQSLRRLGTDYLDLLQLHSPPTDVLERGDFITSLDRLQQAGKIRAYGVSCETTADGLLCLRYPQIASVQVRLSLIDRSALHELLPRAHAQGVGIIVRECFAGGLLAKPLERLGLEESMPNVAEREERRREVEAWHRVAEQHRRPVAELAVKFTMGLDEVSSTLLGMRTLGQLTSNLEFVGAPPLTMDENRSLREVEPNAARA